MNSTCSVVTAPAGAVIARPVAASTPQPIINLQRFPKSLLSRSRERGMEGDAAAGDIVCLAGIADITQRADVAQIVIPTPSAEELADLLSRSLAASQSDPRPQSCRR